MSAVCFIAQNQMPDAPGRLINQCSLSATGTGYRRLIILVFVFLLSACEGEQGETGDPGLQGPPAAPIIINNQAESIAVTIDAVTVEDKTRVELSVVDQNGDPFTGLASGALRFNMAKLVPGAAGDPDHWQNYINRIEAAGGVGTGTEDSLQATTENHGALENHQDGSYTYTFATDITKVTSPVAVSYEPALVHRLGLQVSGEFSPLNQVYTFIPESGASDGFNAQTIVATGSCNACHGKLALHGGGRVETQFCVTCHNPGSTDAQSGNTLDFKVMVHKIHRGAFLPSVLAGSDYTIYGYRNSEHNFSDIRFPQRIENCSSCHDADNPDTPQAANWFNRPSLQACGSCHDDVDFSAGIAGGHPGGVVTDNSECTTCHASDRVAGSVQESHALAAKNEAARYAFNIIGVTNSAPGEFPKVTYSVTDPSNNNVAYDFTEPQWNAGAASRLAVLLAWDTRDYHNDDSGSGVASAISLNALNGVSNGDGAFTVTSSTAIPLNATGSGAVALEGHPAADLDGDGDYRDRVAVTGTVDYFTITDPTPLPRRNLVDVAKCQNCHGQLDGLSLHGNNRTDNIQLCVICHNPNNTDLAMRPADPDGEDNEVNSAAVDGREESPIDFKYLIHAIHGSHHRENPLVVYGYNNSPHDFSEVRFPGILNHCDTCHLDDSYQLPLASTTLATTIDSQATVNSSSPFGSSDLTPPAAAVDHTDDFNIGATASACSGCHDSTLAKAHMELNGSSFDGLQAEFDNGGFIETCAICHGPGRIADVKQVHEMPD